MTVPKHVACAVLILVSMTLCRCSDAQPEGQPPPPGEVISMVKTDFHPLIGGCGGVYFLAEPGELVVEVEKRDRNTRDTTSELRAILVGPDRRVLEELSIPDDGRAKGSGLGPPQRARLSAQVDRVGVYALNITVSRDRYGRHMIWGFRTNCPRYIIETARGHKDERHQEPIVLASPGRPADVCFAPRKGAFDIDVSGLPKEAEALQILDGEGAVLGTPEVDADGRASWTAPADEPRESALWRLRLPSAKATINIDGVTRWNKGEPNANVCCWSPDPASWFPLLENRWLLTPYGRTVYAAPGTQGDVSFRAYNHSERERTLELTIEFPDGEWPVQLAAQRVVLGAGTPEPVGVHYAAPPEGQTRTCHIRATPADAEGFSTYSTLTVRAGEAPATKPLSMPIMLKAYQHENEQFGYLPDYPVGNQVYFDPGNRPYMWAGRGLTTWRAGEWAGSDLRSAVTSRPPEFEECSFAKRSTKVAFDRDGDVYLLSRCGATGVLLHSADGGRTFSAHEIPGRNGALDFEQFSGHNIPDGPPPIVRIIRTAKDPKLKWRSTNDFELLVPRKVNGRIEMGRPILVSKQCIGLSVHSGIPSSVVSRGPKVHVAWGEATDPAEEVPGVPTYVATYDRETGVLGEPVLIGYGPPPNDGHNSPSITMDSQGYLHVLVGTHGRPFQYARSLKPNDAQSGWTEAVLAGEKLNQTYIGFVCGQDDALHVVFRLWRWGEPFPNSSHATLAYQRKRPGQPWEPPRILVVAAFSEYSIFYHRLTIDQEGRLFLSYDYWSTHWFYRNDHRGGRRALLMSPDGGETWKLAETRDLAPR